MEKVMIKDCIKAAIEYNKGNLSTERFCTVLNEYDATHKLVMIYDTEADDNDGDFSGEGKVTKLYLIDTDNHYRTVRTVWRAVEEKKVTVDDVVEAVEQFNDEKIETVDLYDVMNQFDRQRDSKIDVRFIDEHKVGEIFLIIANGSINRTIWEINGQDVDKRFEKYVLNHVKNAPVIGNEPRRIRVAEDLIIRMIPLIGGYVVYERVVRDVIPENTIILNRDGKRLTKPRLWPLLDDIIDAYKEEDLTSLIGDIIHFYNASRRCKLKARIFKGELLISRHDKDDKNRVVYRRKLNNGE